MNKNFLDAYNNDCCYANSYQEYLEGRLEWALSEIDRLNGSSSKQLNDLRQYLKKTKESSR